MELYSVGITTKGTMMTQEVGECLGREVGSFCSGAGNDPGLGCVSATRVSERASGVRIKLNASLLLLPHGRRLLRLCPLHVFRRSFLIVGRTNVLGNI